MKQKFAPLIWLIMIVSLSAVASASSQDYAILRDNQGSWSVTLEHMPDKTKQMLLYCSFDDSLTCANGEQPTLAEGITFKKGVRGQGVYIDGNDALDYSTADNINPTQGTISLWVIPDWNNAGGQRYIFDVFDRYGGTNAFSRFVMTAEPARYDSRTSDAILMAINPHTDGGPEQSGFFYAHNYHAKKAEHLVLTWNLQTGMDAYLNGEKIQHLTERFPMDFQGLSRFINIGYYKDTRAHQFGGVIDELRIYNYPLTTTQIKDLYAQDKPPETTSTPELLLYCPFDGSLTCADGEQPTLAEGITFKNGIQGQGVYIDGNDALDYSTADNINPTQGTISLWVIPDWSAPVQEQKYLIDIFDRYDTTRSMNRLWSVIDPNQDPGKRGTTLYSGINPGGDVYFNNWEARIWYPIDWAANKPHHIALSWDNQKKLNTYLDGVLVGSAEDTFPLSWELSNLINIGYYKDTRAHQFGGVIDELKIFDQELSEAQVKELFDADKCGKKPSEFPIHRKRWFKLNVGGETHYLRYQRINLKKKMLIFKHKIVRNNRRIRKRRWLRVSYDDCNKAVLPIGEGVAIDINLVGKRNSPLHVEDAQTVRSPFRDSHKK